MNAEQRINGAPNRAYSNAYHLPPFELCIEMSKKGNGGEQVCNLLHPYSHKLTKRRISL